MRAMAKRTPKSKAAVKSKPTPRSKPKLKSKTKSKAKPEAATPKTAAEAETSDAKPARPTTTISAVEMGARQREISVSEFFTKNRHLLGFDNPRKALLTCVKEAVDSARDGAGEGGIRPGVVANVEGAAPAGAPRPPAGKATRFRVPVPDNAPGIVRAQTPPIFAKLLYGSKFHRLRMS